MYYTALLHILPCGYKTQRTVKCFHIRTRETLLEMKHTAGMDTDYLPSPHATSAFRNGKTKSGCWVTIHSPSNVRKHTYKHTYG